MSTFAKIFKSILSSSIADDWKTRHVFEDMLKLAEDDGTLDMTPTAIARQTGMPLEMILEAIPKLEAPDPASRTSDNEGRRLLRIAAHRDWGWTIVNYVRYRESASQEMIRMKDAERKSVWRAKYRRDSSSPKPPSINN